MVGLLHETDWDEISIQMICDRADVARSSFYAHFENKIDLLDHVFVSSESEIREMIAANPHVDGESTTLSWLVNHIGESRDLYHFASRSISGQVILSRFKKIMLGVFKHELDDAKITATDDQLEFVFGGVFALIQQWIESGATTSEDQLKRRIYELVYLVIEKGGNGRRTN